MKLLSFVLKVIQKILKLSCGAGVAHCSGSLMDYHETARGSIPGGHGVKTELHVLRKGQ